MDRKMDSARKEVPERGEAKQGMTNGLGTKQKNVDKDVIAKLADETQQHLSLNQELSSTPTTVRVRPKLRMTRSLPPYNRRIGGLGDDREGEWENQLQCPDDGGLHSELCDAQTLDLRPQVRCTEESGEETRAERMALNPKRDGDMGDKGTCIKAKWRRARSEEGGKAEVGGQGWKRLESWSFGVNRAKENPAKEEKEESRKIGKERGERERPVGKRESVTKAHPILSKLLHFSSTASSSSSSLNLSSAESDEVLSDDEDVSSKRKTFRKCRSWRTFLTIMHWSPGRQSSWVQLAGHQGNFQLGTGGEVLKLYSEMEALCLECLMKDPLKPFVPQYHGLATREELRYIRLEDLLTGLKKPVIMDCKMGVRTYQEEELAKARAKPTLRSDMYQKMVKLDPKAPSIEEHAKQGVTKWRYLQWRDMNSSTSALGFRVEGMMMENGSVQRDFRNILSLAHATEALLYFTKSQIHILKAYHSRLEALSDTLKQSPFFRTHEVIGSSLLFVHDHSNKANVWMIDFGKTTPVPDTREIKHNVPWSEGSREDGYLIGLASLTSSLNQAIRLASWQQDKDCEGKRTEGLTEV